MSSLDFIALLPILTLAGFALFAMLQIAFFRRLDIAAVMCGGGCVAALGGVFAASWVAPRTITSLLIIDGYGLFYA